jgi:hypothetical protein
MTAPDIFKGIYREINTLFKTAYEFIVTDDSGRSLRMVARINSRDYVICRDRMKVTLYPQENSLRTLSFLSLKSRTDTAIAFHGSSLRMKKMSEIYNRRRDNELTVVYEEQGAHIIAYVINECGNIFTFIKKIVARETLLTCLFHFCTSVLQQISRETPPGRIRKSFTVQRMTTDRFGGVRFFNETGTIENLHTLKYNPRSSLSATVQRSDETTLYLFRTPLWEADEYTGLADVAASLAGLHGAGIEPVIGTITFTGRDSTPLPSSTRYFLEKYKLEYILDRSERILR